MRDGEEPGERGGRLLRWANRRWVRVLITAFVGLALFVLGAVYLSLGRQPDIPTFMVVGGDHVQAGLEGLVRVSARYADSRDTVPVEVRGVTLGGAPVDREVEAGAPAIVRFRVPADSGEEITLAFDARAGERQEHLEVDLPVLRDGAVVDVMGTTPPTLPDVATDHRVRVLPEAGVLAGNMDNRVFVRVLDQEGRPVGSARVVVTHPTLPDGRVEGYSDASGLLDLRLTANRPSFRLGVEVIEGERRTRTDRLLRPRGRKLKLHQEPAVTPPGEPVRPTLLTWEPDVQVFCDLLRGDAWIRSERVEAVHGSATIDLGALPEGLQRLQCYFHPLTPGESFATVPLPVSDRPPLEVLLDEVRERGLVHPNAAVAPEGTDDELAAAYWQAVLRESPQEPEVLLSSRAEDLAARAAAREQVKSRLLLAIGGVAVLVLLWAADSILKNALSTRDKMRAFAIEAEADGVDLDVEVEDLSVAGFQQRETLVKTRGVLLAIVLFGTIVANILAVLGLLYLIR
ncbi:MAG: hypothetical protein ACQEXJ_01630 [Myxococcota bacterium]